MAHEGREAFKHQGHNCKIHHFQGSGNQSSIFIPKQLLILLLVYFKQIFMKHLLRVIIPCT